MIYVRPQKIRPQGVSKQNSGDAVSQCGDNEYTSVAETRESKGALCKVQTRKNVVVLGCS